MSVERRGGASNPSAECMNVEQGLRLIEIERVQPLLTYLRTGEFKNRTNMTFMKAYSVVVQFGDVAEHSLKLYQYYQKVITQYCMENVQQMTDSSGEDFLRALASLWEKMTILVFWMQRVFQYLDRFFTKNSQEHQDLFSTALRIFEASVYSVVQRRCIDALISSINRERNGQVIDQDVVKQITDLLCTVGGREPKIVKQPPSAASEGDKLFWETASRGVYKADFESALLAASSEYYKAAVTGWLAEHSCPEFLEEVARRLDDEDHRLKRYLHRSSEQELRSVVQKELLRQPAKQLVDMESGCRAMFFNAKRSELSLMYRLFKREPDLLPLMTKAMQPYIEERCGKIVDDPANIDDPMRYVEQVLELKAELDDLVGHCFESGSDFQKARNEGLENVLNKDTRCAKYLAVFCDFQLKKGLKGRTDEEMSQSIAKVIILFAHLRDKDIFLDFYKRYLSRRLLNKLSVSTDAEHMLITRLKVECGQQAIQKLSAMFVDMNLSDQLQDEYNRNDHGGNPGGIQHEVRVLQTNAWPEKPDDVDIRLCGEVLTCITAYELFYHNRHTGRKLRWIHSMGSIEMNVNCFPRRHILSVSTYQALCLLLFNRQPRVQLQDMEHATAIPKEELKRHVLSMTVSKHKLLLKDGSAREMEGNTTLEVNPHFQHEKMKVSVSLIKKDEKQVEMAQPADAPADRKHIVDAAIVRVMKSRKKLDHNKLIEEVLRQCALFRPQPEQIKTQIQLLIEREFLQRDPQQRNVYIYMP
mmetsp:Transcript_4118/g.8984  ORF Transcript_4118/g.8984 Transcript_4118/m.8984 type:complete len:757 (+) Transcript_4118:64-2334(+)